MSYVVLECLECNHKGIYINGLSDGKRCEMCGGLYRPIDGGNDKLDLISKHKLKKIYPRYKNFAF